MYFFIIFFIFRQSVIQWFRQTVEYLQKLSAKIRNQPAIAAPTTPEKPIVLQESLAKKYKNYENKMRERFMKSFETGDEKDWNSNIDEIFYNPEQHHYAVLAENNEYEIKWKSRILIESIPNGGSVIMYYDPYKRGFVYFSIQSIPYGVLNAIAMKYVLIYRCRYFFIDESETPESSKLVDLEKWEPKDTKVANTEGIKFMTSSTKDVWTQSKEKNVFAKFKSYNSPATKAVEQRKGTQNTIKNRFVYLGNSRYFYILQKIPFPVQAKKKMSYKEFKALKMTDKPASPELDMMFSKLKKTEENESTK